jgi:hypothetical protein
MDSKVQSFIRKFSELLTYPEFKEHLGSYLSYDTEEAVIKSINDGVQDFIFINSSPWFRKKPHSEIVQVILILCSYYSKYKELPFSAQQALADGSSDYMDVDIIERVLAVAKTWNQE